MLTLLYLSLSRPLWAADPPPIDYVVAEILELSPQGEWTSGPGTGEAFRVTAEGDQPLTLGEHLGADARIVTHQARVVLHGPDDYELTLYEDTDLVLAEYGAWQRFGAVLYEVHGAFTVRYARFEALVEGTQFLVEGDELGHGSVAVSRGRVRVRSLQGEVRLRRGQLATLEPGMPPERRAWSPRTAPGRGQLADVPSAARPTLMLGADLRGRYGFGDQVAGDGSGELRLRTVVGLPGPFDVVGTVGLNTAVDQGYFPASLGVQSRIGPVSVGGSGQLSVGLVQDCVADTITPTIHGGGTLDLGVYLPLGERLELNGQLSGGWLYGPEVKLGVGFVVAL